MGGWGWEGFLRGVQDTQLSQIPNLITVTTSVDTAHLRQQNKNKNKKQGVCAWLMGA
jgi:hypothetical protein